MFCLIEENTVTTEMADRVLNYCRENVKYGDTVTYDTIERLTGLTRENRHWNGFKQKVIKRLRQPPLGWCLEWHDNVGFYVLTPDQTVIKRPVYRGRKARSQARMAKEELLAVPDNELSKPMRPVKYAMAEEANKLKKRTMASDRRLKAIVQSANRPALAIDGTLIR